MSTTDNLGITLIETNQTQKEVTANAAFAALDAAMCEVATVDVDDGTTTLLDADVREAQMLVLAAGSPGLTGAITVELPAVKRLLLIRNDSGEDATITCEGASTGAEEATIVNGETGLVYCDGAQVYGVVASGAAAPLQTIAIACADETTALTTGAAKVTLRMPFAFSLVEVRASVTTAPTGAAISIGINEDGSTILSTDLTIDATEKTSTTAATPAVISDTALSDDAEITIDLDQVGSTVAGAGLKVYLIGRPV